MAPRAPVIKNPNENYRQFPLQMEVITPTTKSTLFTVSKDEWDTKEGTGKSMKNALHVQQYGKRHLSGLCK